jgi:hypothetical protein
MKKEGGQQKENRIDIEDTVNHTRALQTRHTILEIDDVQNLTANKLVSIT